MLQDLQGLTDYQCTLQTTYKVCAYKVDKLKLKYTSLQGGRSGYRQPFVDFKLGVAF